MPDPVPTVAVVVPTFDRPDQLRECLAALAASDYPRDRYEVIVVDDGSRSPLDSVVDRFRADLDVTLIRQRNAGPAAARNTGAERARGEILAFTDDDCRVDRSWLRDLARGLTDAPGALVGGRTVNAASGIYSAMSQLITDVVYRHYNRDTEHARFLASNNIALPAAAFRELGGFDASFRYSEDRDFCDRWRHAGRRIVLLAGMQVQHLHWMGPAQFCRQHFQYGRGAERFRRVRAGRGSGSMLNEMRFHLDVANWIGYPISRMPGRRALSVVTLLGVWQTANLAGFVYEKFRRGDGA